MATNRIFCGIFAGPVTAGLLTVLLLWSVQAAATPDIEQWQTENGARVLFVHAPELPMVDVRVVFDAGSARDGGKPGRALLTNALLEEGAGSGKQAMDADAIAERFDSLGARFSASSNRDMAVVSLRSLADPRLLDPAVETMALVLGAPSFPEDALKRERNRLLVALRQQEQSPGKIADRTFWAALYRDHPYAVQPMGTAESVSALTRGDLQKHYTRYYVAKNAVVAIVGDVKRAQAKRLVEQVVGSLPAGKRAPKLPEVASLAEGKRIKVDFPSSQTHVLMGEPVLRRGDPDYFPLYVGNHILGGSGLVSRISDEVREKRGLSYSAYSYFNPMGEKGPFTLGLQTRNGATSKALEVLGDTLARFVAEGPTAAELQASQKNITGGFALRVDSNDDIAEYLAMIGFYGLPLDYLDTFNDNVLAVTVEQIHDAFRRRVNPGKMVIVTVGGGS